MTEEEQQEDFVRQTIALSAAVRRQLQGKALLVVIGALADAASVCLAGLDENERESAMQLFVQNVQELIPVNAALLADARARREDKA